MGCGSDCGVKIALRVKRGYRVMMKQLAVPAAHTHIVLDARSSIKALSELTAQTVLLGCAFSCLCDVSVCLCVCVGASVCLILLAPTLSAGHPFASLTRSQRESEKRGG